MIPTLRCDFAESILRFSGVGRVGRLRKILPWIHLFARSRAICESPPCARSPDQRMGRFMPGAAAVWPLAATCLGRSENLLNCAIATIGAAQSLNLEAFLEPIGLDLDQSAPPQRE